MDSKAAYNTQDLQTDKYFTTLIITQLQKFKKIAVFLPLKKFRVKVRAFPQVYRN